MLTLYKRAFSRRPNRSSIEDDCTIFRNFLGAREIPYHEFDAYNELDQRINQLAYSDIPVLIHQADTWEDNRNIRNWFIQSYSQCPAEIKVSYDRAFLRRIGQESKLDTEGRLNATGRIGYFEHNDENCLLHVGLTEDRGVDIHLPSGDDNCDATHVSWGWPYRLIECSEKGIIARRIEV